MPPLNGVFMAFANYAAVGGDLNLPVSGSLTTLAGISAPVCNYNYAQLNATFFPSQYLLTYCASSVYMFALLQTGFGFPMDTTSLRFQDEVANNEIGWALGAMLVEANMLPWNLDLEQLCDDDEEEGTVVALSVALAVMSLSTVLFSVRYWRDSRRRGPSDLSVKL